MTMMDDPTSVNQQGQLLGPKGRRTRQSLMNAAAKLLKVKSLSDLTATEIAKRAKTSAGTFYLYFKDVEDILFALSQSADHESLEILRILEQPWTEDVLVERCRQLVNTFRSGWEHNREVLRARNVEADRGNQRFFVSRLNNALPILDALADRVAKSHHMTPAERPLAFALASVAYAAMERIAATHPLNVPVRGVGGNEVRDAETLLLAGLMSGALTNLVGTVWSKEAATAADPAAQSPRRVARKVRQVAK